MYKWPHLRIASTPYNGHCGPCQIDRSTPSIQLHWPWPWHCGFQLIRVWCCTDHYHDGHKLLPGCCTRDSQSRHKAVLNSKRSSWNGFMRWCWSTLWSSSFVSKHNTNQNVPIVPQFFILNSSFHLKLVISSKPNVSTIQGQKHHRIWSNVIKYVRCSLATQSTGCNSIIAAPVPSSSQLRGACSRSLCRVPIPAPVQLEDDDPWLHAKFNNYKDIR